MFCLPHSYLSLSIFLFVICGASVMAQDTSLTKDKKVVIAPSIGYAQEDFNWSISGNLQGQDPNIFSEIIWKNLRGAAAQLDVTWNAWKRLSILLSLSKTAITAGSASDTDYQDDNRTNPVFLASLKSDKGYTDFIVAGLDYEAFKKERYQIIAGLGFGLHRQSLHLRDREESPDVERLNSVYLAKWTGPYISIVPSVKLSDRVRLSNKFNYNLSNYEATADWNLIDEFQHPVSFRHTSKGYGIENKLEFAVTIKSDFLIIIAADYHYWKTGTGIDNLYLADGNIAQTRLNNAERKGFKCRIGFNLDL